MSKGYVNVYRTICPRDFSVIKKFQAIFFSYKKFKWHSLKKSPGFGRGLFFGYTRDVMEHIDEILLFHILPASEKTVYPTTNPNKY